jgi:sensor histidine kinase regulating citrate/malate metabolism
MKEFTRFASPVRTTREDSESSLALVRSNALEATNYGGIVVVGVTADDSVITYYVHNDSVIPKEVQLQIFQRSFSTRGIGRGTGTYSIKLLTEKYLNGKVSFTSNITGGTIFTIELGKVKL